MMKKPYEVELVKKLHPIEYLKKLHLAKVEMMKKHHQEKSLRNQPPKFLKKPLQKEFQRSLI